MAEYATIEKINGIATLVRGKTKSGRLIPEDIDTTSIQRQLEDILAFVQAQEPNEVEEALQIKEQARQEVEQARERITSLELDKETLQAELDQLIATFKPWTVGESVVKGDVRRSGNELYEVIQDHTTQADWKPDTALSLWKIYNPKETLQGTELIPDFAQPTGAHDAYKIDDKVRFEGKVYRSLIDNNAYSPSAYPAGWEEVMTA